MKKAFGLLVFTLLPLSGCGLLEGLLDGDTSGAYTKEYDAVNGKYVLYENADKRYSYKDTYFLIDGSKESFSLKYYESGKLKKEGKIAKIVTREQNVGKWSDTLHFSVKVGNAYEHICTYAESFSPVNQFRIIDEYYGPDDQRYYLSELPFVMGTYVKEGVSYVAEKPCTAKYDYLTPTADHFTVAIEGRYELDEDTYFYFLNPRGFQAADASLQDSYFQYYSPTLSEPIEGFIVGYSYDYSRSTRRATFAMKTLKDLVDWGAKKEGRIFFGYDTFDESENLIEHRGTIDFSDGVLHSFSFEHLSRLWTDQEWKSYDLDGPSALPDPVLYDFIGGTYSKVS